jgi:CRP-like cAMP-binding protein
VSIDLFSSPMTLSSTTKTLEDKLGPQWITRLQELYLFQSVDESRMMSILESAFMQEYLAHTKIITEGEDSNGNAYIIISGSVEVLMKQQWVARLREGDIFGEYALISEDSRIATVISLEPTECLVINQDAIMKLVDESDDINVIMVRRLRENIEAKR